MTTDIKIGDVVRLCKPHPCGSYEWEVLRTGADIGLKCLKCQRRVLLERGVLETRLKNVVAKSDQLLNELIANLCRHQQVIAGIIFEKGKN